MFSSPVLEAHIVETIKDVGVQIRHARAARSTRVRASYYKVAMLLSASPVEAALYDLIEYKCSSNPSLLNNVRTFNRAKGITTLQQIKAPITDPDKEFWICEIKRSGIDRRSSFKEMNELALEVGIINRQLFNKIDRIRAKRNEIHLQTMPISTRKYNFSTVEKMSKVLLGIVDLY